MNEYIKPIPKGYGVALSVGSKSKDKSPEVKEYTLEQLRKRLTTHREGDKDGPYYLQGVACGDRGNDYMERLQIIALDIDDGTPTKQLNELVEKSGLWCVRYTTHSHGKGETYVKENDWRKWVAANPGKTAADYLAGTGIISSIAQTAQISEDCDLIPGKGPSFTITHKPLDKNRLVFILHEPWHWKASREEGVDAADVWKEAYLGFAKWLGVRVDESCTDVARMLYFPTHPPASAYETEVFEGGAIDLFALPRVKGSKGKKMTRPATQKTADLKTWYEKHKETFQIVAALEACGVAFTSEPKVDMHYIDCPFSSEHGQGNPTRTYVINAGVSQTDNGVFVIGCSGGHCVAPEKRKPWEFLEGMLQQGMLTEEVMNDPAFHLEVEDGEATESASAAKADWESIQGLNKSFALVLKGGKLRYLFEHEDGELEFLEINAIKNYLANCRINTVGKRGSVSSESAFTIWNSHPDRRTYDNVVFRPFGSIPYKANPKTFNLFTGWEVEPKAGDWSLLKGHILENICNGDSGHCEWLLDWMAHLFQHPEEKPGTAVVIRGKKGVGKSKLFQWLRAGVGKYAIALYNPKHLTGPFNGHLARALLVTAEEGFWAGDKAAEGVLKGKITDPTDMIEAKGLDAYNAPSFLRVTITSNEKWVVPATEDERRYFMLTCGNKRMKDYTYFAAIDAQMKSGGLEAMVHELLNRAIKSNVMDAPRTDALAEQILESCDPCEQWLIQAILEGRVPQVGSDLDWGNEGVTLWNEQKEKMRLKLSHALDGLGARSVYKTTPTSFGMLLGKLIPGAEIGKVARNPLTKKAERATVLPPISKAQAYIKEVYGLDALILDPSTLPSEEEEENGAGEEPLPPSEQNNNVVPLNSKRRGRLCF